MKEVKNLAKALTAALAVKGIKVKHAQALDVLSTLSGMRDWNALSAALQARRSTLALRQALADMLSATDRLASQDVDQGAWNEGGFACEACNAARGVLDALPSVEPLDGAIEYLMTPDSDALWIEVDNISVYVRRNDDGVSVDLYPKGSEDGESTAGARATFAEAEPDDLDDTSHNDTGGAEFPQTWVIHSRSEDEASDGAGFWSNDFGWSTREFATAFSDTERDGYHLPLSAGNDAKWVGLLKPYRVSLTEAGESEPILFECHAESGEHAQEQAENAYPDCAVHAVEVAVSRKAPANSSTGLVRKAYDLIAAAKAWQIDDSPVITSMSLDELRGEPENEVFHFNWVDDEDQLYSEILTEEDLAAVEFAKDGSLLFPDADGGPMALRCFGPVAATVDTPKRAPHVCGLDGEHEGDCPACQEAFIYARDLTAEWVGLHYGVNFDAETTARQKDWIARFMDAHAKDNPLYPRSDWEYEVANRDTSLGYAAWLAHQLEIRHDDREMGMLDDDE